MSEFLEPYQMRANQVGCIFNRTTKELAEEMDAQGGSCWVLNTLFKTQSIFLPKIIQQIAGSEEKFFELLTPAAEVFAKWQFVSIAFIDLLNACTHSNTDRREISIDRLSLCKSSQFQTAFKHHESLLLDIANKGRKGGTEKLLDAIQGDTPLIRYRRDLAEKYFQLVPALDGGTICYVGTKIPAVNLKLRYPKNGTLPGISLIVDSLTADRDTLLP